jgi:D-arabinose 1-dehydrogenase-like Zn-dependent alcohol dehydrogenase
VQVSRPNGPFEIVERPIPEPGAGTVRLKVLARGICHSDSLTKEGAWPGLQHPRVPGHEVAGVIDNETFPLERVAEAYDRMMSGKARFRVVLTIGN